MVRLPRLSLSGMAQHVIQCGNNRQACFFTEADYLIYLDKLKEIRGAVNRAWVLGGVGSEIRELSEVGQESITLTPLFLCS